MDYEKTLLNAPVIETESLAAMLGMEENDYEKALARIRRDVESGDYTHALWAGMVCLNGELVKRDVAEALYFLSKAKEAKALFYIGNFYKEEGDLSRAEYWFQKAREAGDITAYIDSILMERAKGDERNYSVIKSYLEKGIQILKENKGAFEADSEQVYLKTFGIFAKDLGIKCIGNYQFDDAIEFFEMARSLKPDDEDIMDFLSIAYQAKAAGYMKSNPMEAIEIFLKALSCNSKKRESEIKQYISKSFAYLLQKKDIPEYLEKEAVSCVEKEAENLIEPFLTSIYTYYYNRRRTYRDKFFYWAEKRASKGYVDTYLSIVTAYLGENHDQENKGYEPDLQKCKYYLHLAEKELAKLEGKDKSEFNKVSKRYQDIKDRVRKENNKIEKHFTHFDAKEVLQEMKAAGSNVFRIPDGYTHIESRLLIDVKGKELIQEIVMTNSVRVIQEWAFGYIPNLKKITLSEELEFLGKFAFDTALCYSGFKKLLRKKPRLERLFIAGTAELEKYCFGDIEEIGELIFGEGRQELDIEILDGINIKYMYLPDSLKKYHNSYVGLRTNIEKISAPSSLKDVIRKQMNYDIKVENVVYRWSKG